MILQHSIEDRNAQRSAWAFTMIELLVVIAIIGILTALVLPAMSKAKASAKSIHCINNLRQLAIAARLYTDSNEDFFPISYYSAEVNGVMHFYAWDLTTVTGNPDAVIPGLLWQGQTSIPIHQCPSYQGGANWLSDPYTGYNYNTSYIGRGEFESIPQPSKAADVRRPAQTVVFGDGQYSAGANKFMRAPWSSPGDESFSSRWSGTQGFRHSRRSNAAFADGHAESLKECYTENSSGSAKVASQTGFLSSDNSLYDLE